MRHRALRALTVAGLLAGIALPLQAPATAAGTAIPPAGTSTDGIDPASIAGSYQLDGGGWAVPVRGARPAWATDEVLAAAAKKPTPAPAEAVAPDAPLSGYIGIRPGSQMIAPAGCTMNFIFRRSGVYAIGTAGHCVSRVGEPVTLLTIAPGSPPSPANLVLVQIGNVISRTENGIGDDFALVSIKPELQSWVWPTIPVVGGPCGSYTGDGLTEQPLPLRGHATVDAGEQIFHYGHGVGIGAGGTPRTGHGLYWESTAFWWAGSVVFGDSGSGARVGTTGLGAAGDVTHLVIFDGKHLGATAAGTRISRMAQLAGGSLVSSPYCV